MQTFTVFFWLTLQQLLCLNFHKQSYNVKKSHSLICQNDAIFFCVIYRFANTECVYLAWKYKVDAEPQIKKPEIMLPFVVKVRLDAALDSYLCPNAKHMFPIFILGGGGKKVIAAIYDEQN